MSGFFDGDGHPPEEESLWSDDPENMPAWDDDDSSGWDDDDDLDDDDFADEPHFTPDAAQGFKNHVLSLAYEIDGKLGRKLDHGEAAALELAAIEIDKAGGHVTEDSLRAAINKHHKSNGSGRRVTATGEYDVHDNSQRQAFLRDRVASQDRAPEVPDRALDLSVDRDRHAFLRARMNGHEFDTVTEEE